MKFKAGDSITNKNGKGSIITITLIKGKDYWFHFQEFIVPLSIAITDKDFVLVEDANNILKNLL